MFKKFLKMFRLLSEIGKLQDTYECSTYNWQNVYHESTKQLFVSTTKEEKEKVLQLQSVFFNMIDCFEKHSTHVLANDEKTAIIQSIINKNQVEQRSEQWYEEMKHMLTASEFSNLFESEHMRGTFIMSKINPEKRNQQKAVPTEFLIATGWGIRFEPVIRAYLESEWKCKIYESGRLKHDTNPLLGASPDGIIVEGGGQRYGRLIEIKCPYSRKIGEGIPFKYWVQMQIQMEVTGLMECEYIEVEIKSPTPKDMNPDLSGGLYSGELYVLEREDNEQPYVYAYTKEEKDTYETNCICTLREVVPYIISDTYIVCVKRDMKWYESTKPLQENFWKDMAKAREGTFVLAESKYKRSRKDICLIEEEI